MSDVQLTSARRWALECGLQAQVVGGYGGPSVITDFRTGLVTYGTSSRVIEKCTEAGWLDSSGRTTDAGRAVLTPPTPGAS